MSTPTKCPQCGAPYRADALQFCTYCGTRRPDAPPPAAARPDHSARFAAARAHPQLRELMQLAPSTLKHTAGGIFGLGFLVVFCVLAGGMLILFATVGGGIDALFQGKIFGVLFSVIPCVIFVGGLFMLVRFGARMGRFHAASLERRLARVLNERVHVSGGEHSSTSYYTTLEWEDGTRRELATEGRLAGKLTRDDLGLAYVKSDVLLDFRRLDV